MLRSSAQSLVYYFCDYGLTRSSCSSSFFSFSEAQQWAKARRVDFFGGPARSTYHFSAVRTLTRAGKTFFSVFLFCNEKTTLASLSDTCRMPRYSCTIASVLHGKIPRWSPAWYEMIVSPVWNSIARVLRSLCWCYCFSCSCKWLWLWLAVSSECCTPLDWISVSCVLALCCNGNSSSSLRVMGTQTGMRWVGSRTEAVLGNGSGAYASDQIFIRHYGYTGYYVTNFSVMWSARLTAGHKSLRHSSNCYSNWPPPASPQPAP